MGTPVTVTFVPEWLITWLIVGLIVGFLLGVLSGRRFAFIPSIILGLLGAVVGGFIFTSLGIAPPAFLSGVITIRAVDVFVSFVGALVLLLLYSALFRRRL